MKGGVYMGIYKGYTEGQNKATQKYQKENLEQVRVWVRKGEREKYKAYAESKGLSLNALVVQLLEKDMKSSKGE